VLLSHPEEALILQEGILKMCKPHQHTIETVKAWMDGTADGRGVPDVKGLSARRLEDPDDLVALHPPMEQDLLIRFARRYLRLLSLVINSLRVTSGCG
jgi:hypothetical protein